MGLHAILEAIRSSGDIRVGEIESRAYAQAHEILINAQLEAERLTEQACEKALEPVSHERARLIHRARLEAMQIIGEARKELVDAALEQVRGRLVNLRTDACYPDVLRQLLLEALAELKEFEPEEATTQSYGPICLEASPDDQAVLDDLLQTIRLDLPINHTLNCWGGVVAKGENGRIVVINTLEARLERAVPYLRLYLAAFFENEGTATDREQPVERLKVMETQSG
jgi:vacuolar-type H+-ATPase subunit E/Vma4